MTFEVNYILKLHTSLDQYFYENLIQLGTYNNRTYLINQSWYVYSTFMNIH